MSSSLGACNTTNKAVLAWVQEMANLCRPGRVFWCSGSKEERKALTEQAVAEKILIRLNQKKLSGCYYHRSNPNDVARVEQALPKELIFQRGLLMARL